MNLRKHYKLYKSGKQWCVMAIATLASTMVMFTTANADTNANNSSEESVNNAVQTEVTTNNITTNNEVQLVTATPKSSDEVASNNANENSNNIHVNVTSDNTQTDEDISQFTPIQPQAAQVKNGWIKENNQWTYYENGDVTSGRNYSYLPTINGTGNNWYLVDNGVVQSGVQKWAGTYYDFDPNTYLRVDNDYRQSQWGDWYLFGGDGRVLSGLQKWAGSYYYFDPSTYLKVTNKNITVAGLNLHADSTGIISGINRNTNFLLSIHDAALDGWRQFGVLPSVTAAQAILESAWGQSALATQGHNLFGIKGSYNGQSIVMRTAEYGTGGYYYINDAFRKYPSNYESVVDHGRFLATNKRYSNLLWKKDYATVTNYLHADGYATDPKYASSLNNVIRTYNLEAWDKEVFQVYIT